MFFTIAATPTQINYLLYSGTTGGLDFVPGIDSAGVHHHADLQGFGHHLSGQACVRQHSGDGAEHRRQRVDRSVEEGGERACQRDGSRRTTDPSRRALWPSSISRAATRRAQCMFHFITDGESDGGDLVQTAVRIYNVWTLQEQGGVVGEDSTFNNKPARKEVVAAFVTTFKDESYITENGKHVHAFVFGPGEKSASPSPRPRSLVPRAEKVSYEVASAMKTSGNLAGNAVNINGHSGLGIEIIGAKSAWP